MTCKLACAAIIPLVGLAHVCIARGAEGQEKRLPNIVLIVADDK